MATRDEAAAHVFLSLSRFHELVRDGSIPKPRGRAGYVLDDVRRGYIESLRTVKMSEAEKAPAAKANDSDEDIKQEKLKKLRAENAARQRELLPVSVLEMYAEKVGAVIQSAFEALPGAIKTRIPHLRGAEVGIIRGELAKAAHSIASFDLSNQGPA